MWFMLSYILFAQGIPNIQSLSERNEYYTKEWNPRYRDFLKILVFITGGCVFTSLELVSSNFLRHPAFCSGLTPFDLLKIHPKLFGIKLPRNFILSFPQSILVFLVMLYSNNYALRDDQMSKWVLFFDAMVLGSSLINYFFLYRKIENKIEWRVKFSAGNGDIEKISKVQWQKERTLTFSTFRFFCLFQCVLSLVHRLTWSI